MSETIEFKGLKGYTAWTVYNKVVFNLVFIRVFTHKLAGLKAGIDEVEEIFASDADDKTKLKDLEVLVPVMWDALLLDGEDTTHGYALDMFKHSDEETQRSMLFEALMYADLSNDEKIALLAMNKDGNGIPYGKANVKSLDTDKLVDMLMNTLVACSRVDVNMTLIDNTQLEELDGKRIDINDEVAEVLTSNPDTDTGSVIGLAITKAWKKYF